MRMTRWLSRASPVAILVLLLGGCEFKAPRSTLDPLGPVARDQFELFMWTFWLSIPVLILVLGVMFYAIFRFRDRPANKSAIPNQIHGSVPLEITWTLIPVIIVILIAVPTVRTVFETETTVEPTADDLIVNVRGYQWWWRFEYPELGIVTANELNIPKDRRVILTLNSADVLHSFWAPQFAGKRDLIPGQDNQLWFIAEQTGVFRGHCAELCLTAHAYMRFRTVVHEEADFDAWVAAFQEEGEQQVQADPLVQRGRGLFATKGCATCHTVAGYYPDVEIGDPDFPNLTNFGLRNTVAAGVLENTPENLAAWLANPQAVKPGNYMPTLWSEDDPNRDEEIAALVAYLLSLGVDDATQATTGPTSVGGGSDGNR